MQQPLALATPECIPIGGNCSMSVEDDVTTYFLYQEVIDRHPSGDSRERNLRIARFADMKVASQHEIAAAFGVSRPTVNRLLSLYRAEGGGVFYKPRRGRGRVTMSAETIRRAERLLASGCSEREAARQLDVAASTFNEHCRSGVIAKRRRDAPARQTASGAMDRSERDLRDRQAPMGRAAHAVEERVAASVGALTEVKPSFTTAASAVPYGGALTALPALLKQGLLRDVSRFLSLPDGYYGLGSVLLLVAFLTLARLRNAESLRYCAPGEWGRMLGLDRAPEVKTLRRKLRSASDCAESLRDWQKSLSQDWMRQGFGDGCATLAVDGHVKTYSGRKGKLPKTFISRQKLCLPASVSYWINALGGLPLMCLHQQIDPKLCKALERDVTPALRELGALPDTVPDLTRVKGEPILNLVFDREGWSPDLFRRFAKKGIAVITWHKGRAGDDWPADDFASVEVEVTGPASATRSEVMLAEKTVALANGLEVRQIRRLLDSGRQAAIVTTHPALPMATVAGAMFSRWSQENFFKTMRDDFNIDALSVRQVAAVDDDEKVVDPRWRERDKAVKNLIARHRSAIVQWHRWDKEKDAAKTAFYRQKKDALAETLEEAKEERGKWRRHVRAGDLPEEVRPDALPSAPRQLLDAIRMIAYRAETAMMPAVMTAQGKKPNARKLLSRLFQSEANIVPQPEQGLLRVQLLGLGSDAIDQALVPLLKELNDTQTKFPDTDLTLFYELTPGE